MAWRIHDNVLRGEIDNRVRGVLRGRIWLNGAKNPVILELRGNAMPDLAGCFLKFKNPNPTFPLRKNDNFNLLQQGSVGDMTASRKVRVPDVPIDEFIGWDRTKSLPPEHIGNSICLEWFSLANGRVVIEGTDWELEMSAPEWRMTPEEDEQRARDAAEGMTTFMQRLGAAMEKHQRGQKGPDEKWDEHDYERFLRECDARTEKYGELLDKYGGSEDANDKIDEAMGWNRDREPQDESLSAEEINEICEEAANAPDPEPDPAREGIDWIRTEEGEIRHPVQHRCFESAMRFWKRVNEMIDVEKAPETVHDFLFEFQTAGVKLSGALNSIAEDRVPPEPAFTVAYLKRALGHLHKSQAALESPDTSRTLPEHLVAEARRELFEIRELILKLMDEFRGR
jgi:hypothetical protein